MFLPKTDLKPAHDTAVSGVLQVQAKGMTGTSSDGLLPVKHTGHLKVPPMPSKLCSIRWHWSLAGESNVWLQSLHSWFSPSSAGEIKRKVKFTRALTKEQVQHDLWTEETFCFPKLRKPDAPQHLQLLKCSLTWKVSECTKLNWALKAQIFHIQLAPNRNAEH